MEYYASIIKRRKILDSHHSDSNKEPNPLLSPNGSGNTNLACLDKAHTEVVVTQDESLNDGKESLLEGSQIECLGVEQESLKSKNKILTDASKSSTNEDGSCNAFVTDWDGRNYSARSKWDTNEDSSHKQVTGWGGRNYELARPTWGNNENSSHKPLVTGWGSRKVVRDGSKPTYNEDGSCNAFVTHRDWRNYTARSKWATNEDGSPKPVTGWHGRNYELDRAKWSNNESSSHKPLVTGWGGRNYEHARSTWTTNKDTSCKSWATGWGGRNYEAARETKLSANVNVGCDINSTKDKTSVEASRGSHPIDRLGTSTESKMDAICSLSKVDTVQENASQVRNEENLPPKILSGYSRSRKKLLVLDVNGLLVDIVADPDEAYKADTTIGAKAVFKRPYCDEFLRFCFERFNVGVWTSRTRRNIERALDFLMRDTQHQLLFCWDQSHCTETGFNTIENTDKPLVLKELKKLWEKQDPKLPWDKGVYDESNTLLLDDSPYKALRNPPYTAIFPHTYCYRDIKDNGLGPEGDLRNYLERLAASDNVQKFIEQNPFGQPPITNNNQSWRFYLQVMASEPEAAKSLMDVNTETGPPHSNNAKTGPSRSRKKLIVIDASGLLVDVTTNAREGYKADAVQGFQSVFKRPYCDEFLKFCFERFNVGVWTSTTGRNIERVLDFLMRETQHKLLFCWDQSHCTDTGFRTVENYNKSLVLKELRRLWEKQDPYLPWDKGDYDASNTLLLEHSSYKALLNPPNTAIFPYPYRHWHDEDNSLGPEGDLRIYLEKLAASENVQKFVQENPFGQRPITKKNLSWGFYARVIRAMSSDPEAHIPNSPEPARCTNSPEPAQCTNSTEPAQCANSTEPAQCTNSTEPAQCTNSPEPAQCTNLTEPAQCTNSSEPAQRANSSEPTQHTNSSVPAQCTNSSKWAQCTNSLEPTQCTNSSEPTQHTNSSVPAQCTNSLEPTQCTNSSEPAESETSSAYAAQNLLELSLANGNQSLEPANDG